MCSILHVNLSIPKWLNFANENWIQRKLRMQTKIISPIRKLSMSCRIAAYSYLYIPLCFKSCHRNAFDRYKYCRFERTFSYEGLVSSDLICIGFKVNKFLPLTTTALKLILEDVLQTYPWFCSNFSLLSLITFRVWLRRSVLLQCLLVVSWANVRQNRDVSKGIEKMDCMGLTFAIQSHETKLFCEPTLVGLLKNRKKIN